MSFACPDCRRPDSLRITHKLELPPDGRSDEITLQIVGCDACAFRGMAVYEESRRGAADSWHHAGYAVAAADIEQLTDDIRQCPQPESSQCECQTHQLYGQVSRYGRWFFPFATEASFNMIWHKGDQ